MSAALKEIMARHTGDDAWRNVRPPLVRLDDAQAAALREALDGTGFTLPPAPCPAVALMSAYGYKRTFTHTEIYVRFTPESRPFLGWALRSAFDPKRTFVGLRGSEGVRDTHLPPFPPSGLGLMACRKLLARERALLPRVLACPWLNEPGALSPRRPPQAFFGAFTLRAGAGGQAR